MTARPTPLALLWNWKTWLLGCLSWLLPFVASIAFLNKTGGLMIDLALFKSLMVVIGGGVGCLLLVYALRAAPLGWLSGLVVGLSWLVLNWGLDLTILLPLSGDNLAHYAVDIGLRYLLLPIIAIAMAVVRSSKS